MSAFIAQFKYAEKLEFGKLLAHLMTRLQPTTPVDCVIPIPLHPKRQQERGFNQTLELAIPLAKKLEIPLNRWDCTRTLSTAKQTSLNAKMRTQNVTDSTFAIAPHFKAKHVLVIEDIVTTGSTINAFATVLKRAGVKTVEVWSCCRTMVE
jgi:ComF family protein